MKRRLSALFALAVTLVLGLALTRWTPQTVRPALSPSVPPEEAPVTLASLGALSDPWWERVEGELADFCQKRGWAYTAYDCQGSGETQAAQAAQLARDGTADIAVVCAVEAEEAGEWVKALADSGCSVVTLGARVEGAVCGATYDETNLADAAADFLQGSRGVILLPDVTEDARLESVQSVFSQRGLPVLETGSTWGDVDFGRDYLTAALARWPQADAVVAFSRTGVLAGAEALEGRKDVKLLCLTCSPALEEEIAEGRLTGALTPSVQDGIEALQTLLPQVAEGKHPGSVSLKIETIK